MTSVVLFWAGGEFFSGAYMAAKHRAADMNTLVAIGTFAAYAFSVVATFAPGLFGAPNAEMAMNGPMSGPMVYYETAAIVVTLILMGRLLEARAGTNRRRDSGADGIASQNRARATRRRRARYPD